MADFALIWPLFVGVVLCGLAALVLVLGLRRLRDQGQGTGGMVQRATTTRASVIGRFLALDALGMLFMLWGVLRWVEIV
jgi:hypothetical protein